MIKNTNEKSLVKINKNSIFFKIRAFFKNLFSKNEPDTTSNSTNTLNPINNTENKRNSFIKELRKIDNEETILLKLQKKYRKGEIKEEDLTEEQINSLCELYDKQIFNLRKSNKIKKEKLLEYRKRLQTGN